jgi:hypothetical protein
LLTDVRPTCATDIQTHDDLHPSRPQHDAADRLGQLVDAADDPLKKACPQPCPELSRSQTISPNLTWL